MHSIGVSYGYNYGEKIDLYQPNRVVDDFSEIVALLG
jgi:phosphoglycolate phosphatase